MTVSTTNNKITYTSDGVTLTYSFTFAVPAGGGGDIEVFLTDTSGALTQLSQPSQYSVALNAAMSPNPTPVGGVVTLVTAPTSGTLITIIRTLPLTQTTSLANQGTLYQPVIESTEDALTMLVQQINELYGRAIVAAVSDPTPGALPPVGQRANQAMGFDASGNPTAFSTLPAGTVSSAMQPVVAAASINAALALLGLTGVAPEPSGVVKAFAGSVAPTGYLFCYGQNVSRTTFAALFTAIGTAYGVGDGSTTFGIPDLRGRVVAGLDNMGGVAASRLTSNTITGGATILGNNNGNSIEQNSLSVGQLPAHTHNNTLTDPGHHHTIPLSAPTSVGSTSVTVLLNAGSTDTSTATTGITITNASVGSGNPVNNVQPTMVMNYIIKT